MQLKVFHTQARKKRLLLFPELSNEIKNWLGDGFYFWQDIEFAEWWGYSMKCKPWNRSRRFDIYSSVLEFDEDEFIDTVFDQVDYYNFVNIIEKFSKKYQKQFREKPNLNDFNLFIKKFRIWENISVIRFQDVPENDLLIEVNGYYYKKRIQIRVNKPELISNFEHFSTKECIS